MPYYCTVPRCTSMAGKAKNVSFHQFPRDAELASLWNKILKRGKPYTKYSKVCSLHFRPEDYTITSVGKNKGQWRTLRKDAVPSQNLPLESPGPSRVSAGYWIPNLPTNVPDAQILSAQHQVAQAIYLQTMLASQAVANGSPLLPTQSGNADIPTDLSSSNPSNSIPDFTNHIKDHPKNGLHLNEQTETQEYDNKVQNSSFQCQECSKCFKDPDVFMLHRRTHKRYVEERLPSELIEKENYNANAVLNTDETLKANPILANLLKCGMSSDLNPNLNKVFDVNNILSIENQIMAAVAVSMESYIRNISMLQAAVKKKDCNDSIISNDNSQTIINDNDNSRDDDLSDEDCSSNENFIDEQKVHKSDDTCQEIYRLPERQDVKGENIACRDENRNNYQEFKLEDQNHDEIDHKELNHEDSDLHHDDSGQSNDESGQNHDESDQNHNESDQNHDENDRDHDENYPHNPCHDTQDSVYEPNCDNQDLNESKDSNLVIDETV